MTRTGRTRGFVAGLLATALTSAATQLARAEIGAVGGDGPDAVPIVYLAGITEDPDPIVNWQPLGPLGSGRILLNPQGAQNHDGRPAVATSLVSRSPVVAWSRSSGGAYDVVVSRFVGGAWSDPEVVAASPYDDKDPSIAIGPDGTVHLFYWEAAPTPRVMYRSAPADLSSWSVPVQVSDAGQSACRPAAVVHAGTLHVAYEVHDYGFGQTPRQVVLARRDAGSFVPEIVAITSYTGEARPEVHSHLGRLWVDWIDSASELAWTRLDAQGHWESLRYETFASVEEREYFVRGAARSKATEFR
jgi:hypothetical protein